MSRNEKKIRKLAADLGIRIKSIVWEPWGQSFEMQGIAGGWIINEDPIGLNIEEALGFMRQFPDSLKPYDDDDLQEVIDGTRDR